RLRRDRQLLEMLDQQVRSALRRLLARFEGANAVRHPVVAQRIELGQPALQRMESEHVGDRQVELRLLPGKRVATRRRRQPFAPLLAAICPRARAPYNPGFTHLHAMQPPQSWRFAPEPHPFVEAIDAFDDNYIWLLRAP